jgi:two-component system cell cycle sensor histidine kinase/response regulator CckA
VISFLELNKELFIGLINNTALLISLGLIYDTIFLKDNIKNEYIRACVNGVILAVISIAVMMTPVRFSPGIVFDTRSILLGVSGLYFGTIPTVIAMVFSAIYRISQGGAGVYMGVGVIFTSGLTGII